MDKIQFESEEQARELLIDAHDLDKDKKYSAIEQYIENLKNNGYIKKSELEIARDEWIKIDCGSVTTDRYNALFNYAKELEKEIQKLK